MPPVQAKRRTVSVLHVCIIHQAIAGSLLDVTNAELPPPVPAPVPRRIMFQRKRANRRIMNEDMFVNMLREFGEVRRRSAMEVPSDAATLSAWRRDCCQIAPHVRGVRRCCAESCGASGRSVV